MMELAIGFVIGTVTVGLIDGFLSERREWNNGICRDTGNPWRRFDRSSQGCRGYKSGAHTLWVSYPFIEPKEAET
jgi:hypothetical protein